MKKKKIDLDEATIQVMRRMLATPPKPHDEIKVGRPSSKKKRDPKKDPAASAKPRNA